MAARERAAADAPRRRASSDEHPGLPATTFALADEDARAGLVDLPADRDNGIFKGPYLRVRTPFRPAADGWRDVLEWHAGFPPYGHQAAAFARLTSLDVGPEKPRPLPTLVTTGTGSGKTEAFLLPDPRPRAARQAARRHRHQGADPLPDERAGQ